jgi:hypothetical protein
MYEGIINNDRQEIGDALIVSSKCIAGKHDLKQAGNIRIQFGRENKYGVPMVGVKEVSILRCTRCDYEEYFEVLRGVR